MTISFNIPKRQIPSEANLRRIIQILTGLMASQSTIESQCLLPYDETKTYAKGQICLYENQLYLCKTTTTGNFDQSKWILQDDSFDELTLDQVKALISLTDQELKTMTQLISDSEVRLDKTYSSSKIYTDIQDAISSCKQYVLIELAKKSTGSFKKANDTTEVTDGNYLYLIMNSVTSKYDIYALVDSNVELLTSVDVNLDDYLTKTDAENTYLKKTDADGKYATITTVDGKVDKTSIVTSIDSTSTNDTVPTTKSVWDSLYKICDSQVLVDANNPTSKICMADLTTLNTPSKEGVTRAESSLIISIEGRDYWNGQISICMAEPEVYVRSVRAVNTWTKWKRLCTTSVADVPTTLITSEDTTVTVNQNSVYTVINGICYIQMWGFKVDTVGQRVINSSLPKPKTIAQGVCSYGSEGRAGGCIYIYPYDNKGKLYADINITGQSLYSAFSYPVAES